MRAQAQRAEEKGAVGFICVNSSPDDPPARMISFGNEDFLLKIPSVMVSTADGDLLRSRVPTASLPLIQALEHTAGRFMATSVVVERQAMLESVVRLVETHTDAADATVSEKAKIYVKTMSKVIEVGEKHIDEEKARTTKLLGSQLSDARKAKFGMRIALLEAFIPSKHGSMNDGSIGAAGGGGELVMEIGSNIPLGHRLRREYMLKQRVFSLMGVGVGAEGEGSSDDVGDGDLGEMLMRLAEHFSQEKFPAETQVMLNRAAEFAETAEVQNPELLYGIAHYYWCVIDRADDGC